LIYQVFYDREQKLKCNEKPDQKSILLFCNTVDSRYNEVGYNEQLDIVNNFWLFGGLSIEIMLKNSVYYELRYNEFLDIMNDFTLNFRLTAL
jgi:hypothetical protein